MNDATTIEAGTTLTARSICDSECIFTAEVIKATAKTITVKCMGNVKRCKIHEFEGRRFIYATGRYSMAPTFRLP